MLYTASRTVKQRLSTSQGGAGLCFLRDYRGFGLDTPHLRCLKDSSALKCRQTEQCTLSSPQEKAFRPSGLIVTPRTNPCTRKSQSLAGSVANGPVAPRALWTQPSRSEGIACNGSKDPRQGYYRIDLRQQHVPKSKLSITTSGP